MIPAVLASGALIGLGVFVLVRELFPAPPALGAALERYIAPGRRPRGDDAAPNEIAARIGRWLAARIAGTALDVRIPRRDLALLGKTTETYLFQKLAMTVFGLTMPTVLWALFLPSAPWLVSTGFTAIYAAIMFFAPDIAHPLPGPRSPRGVPWRADRLP